MRVFQLKGVARYCRKANIDDRQLLGALDDLSAGLIDANLGGGIYKQRIARKGGGKSGGYRTILVVKFGYRCVFVHCFAKNETESISVEMLEEFRHLGRLLMTLDDGRIDEAIDAGRLVEISG